MEAAGDSEVGKATRRKYTAEEEFRIVLEGLRGRSRSRNCVELRGDRADDVLPVVEGVPGRGEERADPRHAAGRDDGRGPHPQRRERRAEEGAGGISP